MMLEIVNLATGWRHFFKNCIAHWWVYSTSESHCQKKKTNDNDEHKHVPQYCSACKLCDPQCATLAFSIRVVMSV